MYRGASEMVIFEYEVETIKYISQYILCLKAEKYVIVAKLLQDIRNNI